MIGESLLLLKGHSRSHVTRKVLCPFQLKCIVPGSCNKSYKIEYIATVMCVWITLPEQNDICQEKLCHTSSCCTVSEMLPNVYIMNKMLVII